MLHIIPQPKDIKITKGTIITKAEIDVPENTLSYDSLTDLFRIGNKMTGIRLTCGKNGISLVQDPALEKEEYSLISGESSITLSASGHVGFVRALSTLFQIIKPTEDKKGISCPECTIKDRPDSEWRGLCIDLARQYHSMDLLLKYIDYCFILKIDRLQLHLTDDESFTFPCKSFPRLVTKDRSYTRSQLKALTERAEHLGISIVPEIDMPGHSKIFTTEYPEVFGRQGIMAANDGTFRALEKIYTEVEELFPNSEYIHVGGDEAVIGRWQSCRKSLNYEKKNGIDGYIELYGYYIGYITDFILSTGRKPVVWEGFFEQSNKYVSKKVIVMGFESYYQLPDTLVRNGYSVINCSWLPLYMVSPWKKWEPDEILEWNKYTWRHFIEQSPATKKPIVLPDGSPVLGGQYCVWGDYIKEDPDAIGSTNKEFSLVKPRLAALAEKTWNDTTKYTKKSFQTTLDTIISII